MPENAPSTTLTIRTRADQSGLRALQAGLQRLLATARAVGGATRTAFSTFAAESRRARGAVPGPVFDPHLAGRKAGRDLDRGYAERAAGQRRAQHELMHPSVREDPGWSFQQSRAYGLGQRAEQAALGGSVEGFLFGSAEKYMQLDRVMTQMGRRFRMAKGDVQSWGYALGFTTEQAADLMSTLGAQTNTVSKGRFSRYAGFARDRGLDPGAAMGSLGQLEQLTGGFGDAFLMNIAGRATARGMGQGRLQEYLQGLAQTGQSMFAATGSASPRTLAAINDLPSMVFGANNPAGQGAMGAGFMQGLQGTLTGQGAMQSFMLRTMGFGKEGGPGYIEAMKRLDAGVYDPRNLQDLFGEFQSRGLGESAQFRALQSVSGGQLKAWQIEALVKRFGTAGGLEDLKKATAQGAGKSYLDQELAGYSPEDQATFRSQGFAGLGRAKGRISTGESAAVQFEGMQMAVGPQMAKSLLDMRDVITNLAKSAEKMLGMNPLDALNKLTDAMVKVSANLEKLVPEDVPQKVLDSVAQDPRRATSAARVGGAGVLLVKILEGNVGGTVGGSGP